MGKLSQNQTLKEICNTLKKVIQQLKPYQNSVSFVLVIGKTAQGKSTLLRHASGVERIAPAAYELYENQSIDIYFNSRGVFVEITETWLNQSNYLLQDILKQFNRCHRIVKITGIILCIDVNQLFITDPTQFSLQCKTHIQLLERFGEALNQKIEVSIFFTQMDKIAGFCDYYEHEHEHEHEHKVMQPLGFSLLDHKDQDAAKRVVSFKQKFDQLIDSLNQQVIQKMHPVRSSIKRTHIREFPLQLAMLRSAIQYFIQMLSPRLFIPTAVYFTSAVQGGHSLDRLNSKIQQEYALVLQESYPQSFNYKAYFVEPALLTFQEQTSGVLPSINQKQKMALGGIVFLGLIWTAWLSYQHLHSSKLLDRVSRELVAYDNLSTTKQNAKALYHLAQASTHLDQIHANTALQPSLQQLKISLNWDAKKHLQDGFLPKQVHYLEEQLADPRLTHVQRYQALKIYLMLGDQSRFQLDPIVQWFVDDWTRHNIGTGISQKSALLKKALLHQKNTLHVNMQLVIDVRNYLNALPKDYLYYALAQDLFPKKRQSIQMTGFRLPETSVPIYFLKSEFSNQLQRLPEYVKQLSDENWILARQDLGDLLPMLQQAYRQAYVTWWKKFISHCYLSSVQDYQSTGQLIQELSENKSIDRLIEFIQSNTRPDLVMQDANMQLFNQKVASQFTDLNLMSSSVRDKFSQTLTDLGRFLTTVAIVDDQGKTAFNLAKARFSEAGKEMASPLTALAEETVQLPEPLSTWGKQLLNASWGQLLGEARHYINQAWLNTVYEPYQKKIANRFPLNTEGQEDIALQEFNQFFAQEGILHKFAQNYLYPFLDTSQPDWKLKAVGTYVMPISKKAINELIRANVITNMFFPNNEAQTQINFSLQKLNLDPIVDQIYLKMGDQVIKDNQNSESTADFVWPSENAKLVLKSIEGQRFSLEEHGVWAFFKLLQKVNVLVDEEDSANLQILFEINGNSGRYLLKTQNKVNPFIPGILSGFHLNEKIV